VLLCQSRYSDSTKSAEYYKELQDELGCYIPNNGYLMPWAKQGVFLLNTTMTVERGMANSHAGKGALFRQAQFLNQHLRRIRKILFIPRQLTLKFL